MIASPPPGSGHSPGADDDQTQADFLNLLRGRRVALVGPGESITGSRFGGQIDAHDLVVRINHGWPVPPEWEADLGQRADVLYHCCNADYPVVRVFEGCRPSFGWACFEHDDEASVLLEACRQRGIRTLEVTRVYHELRTQLGTFPNTGVVAIHHLLASALSQLSLFGLTFFRGPYRAGYPADGAAPELWPKQGPPPNRIWQHDLQVQYECFQKWYRQDPRLAVDPESRKVMPELIRPTR